MSEQVSEQAQQDGQAPAPDPSSPVPVERFMGAVALIAAVGLAVMALDLMGVPVLRLLGFGPPGPDDGG